MENSRKVFWQRRLKYLDEQVKDLEEVLIERTKMKAEAERMLLDEQLEFDQFSCKKERKEVCI